MELDQVKKNVRQYITIKNELKVLETRQSELKARLVGALDELEPDDRGHKVLHVKDDIVGEVKLTKQRKVSKNLDMSIADEVLTAKGIKDSCIVMVPTLDSAAIMSAYYEGSLTEEDIDKMFPAKESYAFLMDTK
jgi:hypothetical protein